jgi:hypothetical protein
MGELLVAEGVLTEAMVERALDVQRLARVRLGTILLDWELLGEEKLLQTLATLHRCEAVSWERLSAAPAPVVALLPATSAMRLAAIPYALEGRSLRVAFTNPSNLDAVDEVSAVTGRRVVPDVVSEIRLLQAQHLFYGRPVPPAFRTIIQKLEGRLERPRSAPFSPLTGRGVSITRDPPLEPLVVPDFELPEFPVPSRSPGAGSTPLPVSAEPPPAVPAEEEPADQAGEPEPDIASRMWKANTLDEGQEDLVSRMWSASGPPGSLEDAPSRDEIARCAAELVPDIPRVLLLASGPKGVTGWRGRGQSLTDAAVAALKIPWSRASIFVNVKLWGTPHFGTVTEELWPSALGVLLQAAPPFPCAVFPIKIQERVIALYYADRLGEPLSAADYENLEKAAAQTGAALAQLILRQKKGSPPVH